MDELKPEEGQGQVPLIEASQSPEEVSYQAPTVSPVTEEVKPQVVGALEEKASGMAISAMIVGIAGILCSLVIFFSFPLGVTALVLGLIEFKRIKDGAANEKGRGMALTGIILGSLTIVGAIIFMIVIIVTAVTFAAGMSSWLPSMMNQFGTF